MSETKQRISAIEMIGKRFGRLTVISETDPYTRPNSNSTETRFICNCDCGNQKIVVKTALICNRSKSCGCLHKEAIGKRSITHGKSNTPEYETWHGMIQRCYNPNFIHFKNYGGRGIIVCEEWKNSFTNFLNDMGKRPSPKHSIDRKENNGIYKKSNCKWSTKKEQQNNRRPWSEWNFKDKRNHSDKRRSKSRCF